MFLRPDWTAMNNGLPVPHATFAPEPVMQAGTREKGGSLTDLFKKLDEGGVK